MRHTLFAAFLLCFSALVAPALEAQEIRSPYRFVDERQSVGLFGGYLLGGPGTPEVGPQNAPLFGVRYNLRLTGPLSGEAALGFASADRNVLRFDTATAEATPVGTAPMNLLLAEAGLRFHLTGARAWRGLAPYVVATGGLAADLSGQGELDGEQPESQRFDFGPSFAVAVGAGTDFFLTERVSLRLEARNHLLRVPVPPGLTGGTAAQTQWTSNLGLTLGTALHF